MGKFSGTRDDTFKVNQITQMIFMINAKKLIITFNVDPSNSDPFVLTIDVAAAACESNLIIKKTYTSKKHFIPGR